MNKIELDNTKYLIEKQGCAEQTIYQALNVAELYNEYQRYDKTSKYDTELDYVYAIRYLTEFYHYDDNFIENLKWAIKYSFKYANEEQVLKETIKLKKILSNPKYFDKLCKKWCKIADKVVKEQTFERKKLAKLEEKLNK